MKKFKQQGNSSLQNLALIATVASAALAYFVFFQSNDEHKSTYTNNISDEASNVVINQNNSTVISNKESNNEELLEKIVEEDIVYDIVSNFYTEYLKTNIGSLQTGVADGDTFGEKPEVIKRPLAKILSKTPEVDVLLVNKIAEIEYEAYSSEPYFLEYDPLLMSNGAIPTDLRFEKPLIKGNNAEMKFYRVMDGSEGENSVLVKLRKKDGKWKIYDVIDMWIVENEV